MKVTPTQISDVLIIQPQIFEDHRGFFFESFNQKRFAEETGLSYQFVQDNHSHSKQNILRGLHYQLQQAQGKLLRVVTGEIFDVAVDIRRNSETFGQWVGIVLSSENKKQLWIPPGFAHGFYVLSASADVLYKTTNYHASQHERSLSWNDPTLAIDWPIIGTSPVLSAKDRQASPLASAEVFES
ncbi:MAG: dTDP-4-dehydrorhamnose 3,5-epimerase [Leptolyngbyaceae cyanobacterium]